MQNLWIMRIDYHVNTNQKKSGLVILISDRVEFRTKNIITNKIVNFTIVRVGSSRHLNIYASTNKTSKYIVCPDSIQPHSMKNRGISWRRYKTQETYIWQWHLTSLQNRHLGTSHSSPKCSQLPCHNFLNLTDGLKPPPFQRVFQFLEKAEVIGHQTWALGGLSHLGDLMFCQKILHETWCMSRYIVMMKLPVTSCP